MDHAKIKAKATMKQAKTKTATSIASVEKAITNLDKHIDVSLKASKAKSGTGGRACKTSLWACFTPWDLAILTMFCPCITFGKTFHRLQNNGDTTDYEQINAACMVYYFARCWCAQPIPICMQYTWFREKHNLEGTLLSDALKAPCCCPALMQMEKESKLVFAEKRAGLDGVVEEQYTSRSGETMIMARQVQTECAIAIPSAPLNRISEETVVTPTQGDAVLEEKIGDDGVSGMTAVNAEGLMGHEVKTLIDGANEMAVADAHFNEDSDSGLQTDSTSDAVVQDAQNTTKHAATVQTDDVSKTAVVCSQDTEEHCTKCQNSAVPLRVHTRHEMSTVGEVMVGR